MKIKITEYASMMDPEGMITGAHRGILQLIKGGVVTDNAIVRLSPQNLSEKSLEKWGRRANKLGQIELIPGAGIYATLTLDAELKSGEGYVEILGEYV